MSEFTFPKVLIHIGRPDLSKPHEDLSVIQQFAGRLTARGKKGKVVVVACMRKLLSLINAMVRDRLEWNQLDVVKKLAPNP